MYAQQNIESDIREIRDLYSRAQDFIQHDKEDPTIEYQLSLSLQRHHTVEGPVLYDYNFYFDWDGPNGISGSPRLKFVRVKITDRGEISNEEYLFNEKEEPVFFFTKYKDYPSRNDVEIRLYYKNGAQIRNLAKITEQGNNKVTDYTTLPEDYQGWIKTASDNAERTINLFKIGMNH